MKKLNETKQTLKDWNNFLLNEEKQLLKEIKIGEIVLAVAALAGTIKIGSQFLLNNNNNSTISKTFNKIKDESEKEQILKQTAKKALKTAKRNAKEFLEQQDQDEVQRIFQMYKNDNNSFIELLKKTFENSQNNNDGSISIQNPDGTSFILKEQDIEKYFENEAKKVNNLYKLGVELDEFETQQEAILDWQDKFEQGNCEQIRDIILNIKQNGGLSENIDEIKSLLETLKQFDSNIAEVFKDIVTSSEYIDLNADPQEIIDQISISSNSNDVQLIASYLIKNYEINSIKPNN